MSRAGVTSRADLCPSATPLRAVRLLPCSGRCANWLRYGIQPDQAGPGMVPGHCKAKAHDRDYLGLGGRRVLVSRQWTGKTLTDHRADRAAVVRAALEAAGIDPDEHDELTASGDEDGWSWELLGRSQVDERTYMAAITVQVATRTRWHDQYTAAKGGAGPPGRELVDAGCSATRSGGGGS